MECAIDLPAELERALRERAATAGTSFDAAVVDAIARGLGVNLQRPRKRRDLSEIAGRCLIDPETEAAFEEQRRIDPEMWK